MDKEKYSFGMIGLGTMGRNLLLNMGDNGFAAAGYDKDATKITLLENEGQGLPVKGFTSLQDFLGSLSSPKVIMMLVPAGKIVDNVIDELTPLLDKGDIIIDGGNSHFTDTTARVSRLEEKGLHFFGMGVSGGEEGARRGPSMMPGGDTKAYAYMKPVFEKIAAKINGEPCVAYIGPGASGHFVKMVHNGIEYALMQLIADAYEIMKKRLQLSNEEIRSVFAEWNNGRLKSYLLEITADIFAYKEEDGNYLVDKIKDEARSIPTIDVAVALRNLSKYKSLRTALAAVYPAEGKNDIAGKDWITKLEAAFYFSTISIYAQGLHLLSKASAAYTYQLKLDEIAKIWRGGCIIRAALLEDIYSAYKSNPALEHLFLDAAVQSIIKSVEPAAREVVSSQIAAGISIPAFANALSYFDAIRSEKLPQNLVQAQRDYFGAHTYELVGKEGVFHTEWDKK
jgi:6-phosphogluconate dehydrogenase